MTDALICDPVRTPIGRYGGALASVRTDDLAAVPVAALLERNENLDPVMIEEAQACLGIVEDGGQRLADLVGE